MKIVNPIDRFMSKVLKTESCWLWQGAKNTGGYGRFSIRYSIFMSHRWLYEYVNGPVDDRLDLDHLCRIRHCVNPEHLEPVTRRENTIRGIGPKLSKIRQSSKTRCPQGHEYNNENTYFYPNKNNRTCRICHRENERIRRENKRITKENTCHFKKCKALTQTSS